MQKLIKLKLNNDVVYDMNLGLFLDPECIYVPVKKNFQILIKNNQMIYKDQIIMENNLDKVTSSVSGKVVGICNQNIFGQSFPCIKILNDYEEKNKLTRRARENKFTKEKIISLLYEFYFKEIAKLLETKKINNLIISGLEDEPYIWNNPYILNKYSKEILDITDTLSCTFAISNTLIAVKSNDSCNVEKYLSVIGTYPNINIALIDDKYLLAKPFFLLDFLHLQDADSLVLDAKLVYKMYYALKYHELTNETFITLANLVDNKVHVIKVKNNALFSDAVSCYYKIDKQKNDYILGGLMSGMICDIDREVVCDDSIGIVILPKNEIKTLKCNNCGLCYKICPVKINPKKAMDKKEKNLKCLDCGLCSYICPCHINLRTFLKGEK